MDKVLRPKSTVDRISEESDLQGISAKPSGSKKDSRVEALYVEYIDELSDGIRGRFGDGPPDPDEIAQEAFKRIFEKSDSATISNLKAFVWRTARNLVLDFKKTKSVRSKYDFEIEQIFFPLRGHNLSPESVIMAKQQLDAINDILLAMPERRRRSLMLYRIDGLTLEQVGKRLGISRRAVSKHISRAHTDIAALFIEDPSDET